MSYFEKEAKARAANGEQIHDIAAVLRCPEAKVRRALQGEYVVRVVLASSEDPWPGNLLAFVRMMQVAYHVRVHRDDKDVMCFDIMPPLDVHSDNWADNLAKRMSAEGFNAVRAPRWVDEVILEVNANPTNEEIEANLKAKKKLIGEEVELCPVCGQPKHEMDCR